MHSQERLLVYILYRVYGVCDLCLLSYYCTYYYTL